MKKILLLKVWTNKNSSLIGLIALIFVLLWPSIPLRSVDLWFQTLLNLYPTKILYPILAFLTGSYAAIYYYNKKVQACCLIDNGKIGATSSLIGIFWAPAQHVYRH
jgi:hypothetical protein